MNAIVLLCAVGAFFFDLKSDVDVLASRVFGVESKIKTLKTQVETHIEVDQLLTQEEYDKLIEDMNSISIKQTTIKTYLSLLLEKEGINPHINGD